MEKTIYQILDEGSIVYASEQCDTIISISSTKLRWYFATEDGKYSLADTLDAHNDLSKMSLDQAKKLASDWFNWAFENDGGSDNSSSIYSDSDSIIAEREASKHRYRDKPPAVIPKDLDADKKDVHTEHCCSEHKQCKYNRDNCPVLTGKKKSSYPCNCEWM